MTNQTRELEPESRAGSALRRSTRQLLTGAFAPFERGAVIGDPADVHLPFRLPSAF